MATVLSTSTATSWVISLLQASQTPWSTTVDGSNAQYNSDSEIASAILTADLECGTLICNAPGHPYQTPFVQAAATLTNGSNLPTRNGMILRVTGQVGSVAIITFAAASISTTTDLVTTANHGLVTGQVVQVANGGALPTGLVASTNYYIYAPSTSTYGFCSTIYNAKSGTLIDITNIGSGTNTVTTQYTDILETESDAVISEAVNFPYLFAPSQGITAGFWASNADTFYTTCISAKATFTDITLTSSCQCPQPMLFAIVCGAIAKLCKDGSDENMAMFYTKQYEMYQQQISAGARIIPEISQYTLMGSPA